MSFSGSASQRSSERASQTMVEAFSAGEYKSDLCKKWLKYCQTAIPLNQGGVRIGHDEYTHYYYAQALYILGQIFDANIGAVIILVILSLVRRA